MTSLLALAIRSLLSESPPAPLLRDILTEIIDGGKAAKVGFLINTESNTYAAGIFIFVTHRRHHLLQPPSSPPPDHLDWLRTRIRAWEEEERRSPYYDWSD